MSSIWNGILPGDTSTKYSSDPTLSLFLSNFIQNDRHFFIVIVVLCWLLLVTFKSLLGKPFNFSVLFVCSFVYSVRHCGLLWFDQGLCTLSIALLHSLFPSKKICGNIVCAIWQRLQTIFVGIKCSQRVIRLEGCLDLSKWQWLFFYK